MHRRKKVPGKVGRVYVYLPANDAKKAVARVEPSV